MNLKVNELEEFIEKYRPEGIFIFGFTFMIWQYLYQKCKGLNLGFNIQDGILIHSGGWKKLNSLSITNAKFKEMLIESFNLKRVYNFYGMVEQVGSIYMECEEGFFHAPNFAEILVRDYRHWNTTEQGQSGVIQTLSVLPGSYPGHSLLTEDVGTIIGIDDCSCGRTGTYFIVEGRIPKAELRGCSDTHAETFLNVL